MLELRDQLIGLDEMDDLSPDYIELMDFMMDVNSDEILDAIGEGFAEIKDILAALTVRFNTLLQILTMILNVNF